MNGGKEKTQTNKVNQSVRQRERFPNTKVFHHDVVVKSPPRPTHPPTHHMPQHWSQCAGTQRVTWPTYPHWVVYRGGGVHKPRGPSKVPSPPPAPWVKIPVIHSVKTSNFTFAIQLKRLALSLCLFMKAPWVLPGSGLVRRSRSCPNPLNPTATPARSLWFFPNPTVNTGAFVNCLYFRQIVSCVNHPSVHPARCACFHLFFLLNRSRHRESLIPSTLVPPPLFGTQTPNTAGRLMMMMKTRILPSYSTNDRNPFFRALLCH